MNDTLRKLIEESKRTAAVVRRLRDFFRSGATRLERVALHELVAKVIASLHAKAASANVTLTSQGGRDIPPVLVDSVQIEVVLRNVLMNAIESAAAPPASQVDVKIEANQAGEVVVAVRDSGPGIGETDVERLFDSFVTTKTSGMGMGLAISRAIIDAHGGRIWAVAGDTGLVCFALPVDKL